MPKVPRGTKHVPLPSPAELEAGEAALARRRGANRKKRVSKLRPYLEDLAYCCQKGRSLDGICAHLMYHHKLSVAPSTVLRFLRVNPLLRERSNRHRGSAGTAPTGLPTGGCK